MGQGKELGSYRFRDQSHIHSKAEIVNSDSNTDRNPHEVRHKASNKDFVILNVKKKKIRTQKVKDKRA